MVLLLLVARLRMSGHGGRMGWRRICGRILLLKLVSLVGLGCVMNGVRGHLLLIASELATVILARGLHVILLLIILVVGSTLIVLLLLLLEVL